MSGVVHELNATTLRAYGDMEATGDSLTARRAELHEALRLERAGGADRVDQALAAADEALEVHTRAAARYVQSAGKLANELARLERERTGAEA